jgi:cysteine desulfurase/selenocysteine lyase
MNTKVLRDDFSFLTQSRWIYFDNACQSLRPRQVVEAIADYYNNYPVCAGRSNYRLAVELQNKLTEVRQQVTDFIGAKKSNEIVFTRNTTEGINLIANCYQFEEGDVVLISDKEHNSNLIPWLQLVKSKKIKLEIVKTNDDNSWNWANFEEKLTNKVKLVSLGITSNLDGITIPFKEIITKSHSLGAKVLLDGAQWVGHNPTNVSDWDVDFLVFSGHKTLGPSGTGVLYGKMSELEKLTEYQLGGSTVADSTYTNFELLPIPQKFEAGLQDYADILGLGKALEYLKSVGWDNIKSEESKVSDVLYEGISNISGIEIIGGTDSTNRNGIISFYHPQISSHQISILLDQNSNILVRSGRHCVHSWFNARNITDSVRISASFYNTIEEAEKTITELKKIVEVLT